MRSISQLYLIENMCSSTETCTYASKLIEHTILDIPAFSCPVPAAELCIVEYRFLFGGDFGIPGSSLSIQVRL
jgi:hypothetical protein